jgi:hypothetical protein
MDITERPFWWRERKRVGAIIRARLSYDQSPALLVIEAEPVGRAAGLVAQAGGRS